MNVTELEDQLERILAARDAALAMGLEVTIPAELRDACAALVRLAEEQGPADSPSPAAVSDVERDQMYQLLPLRRLLWHVLTPGQLVTVPEVTARLAELGRVEAPAKVSNALGVLGYPRPA
ncbi:MAG: hypothetical protein ACRDZY_00185 [Acidimicrobiales bacterium]